jgi:hypothetical protein
MQKEYCQECFNKVATYCRCCDKRVLKEDIVEDEFDSQKVCKSCYKKQSIIRRYDFKPPELEFHKTNSDTDENLLHMGFELEVEPNQPDYTAAEMLQVYLKKHNLYKSHYYMKHDGSLRGFEIVSQPMTLRCLHQKAKLSQILKFMQEKGFTSFLGGKCGFHVHVSRKFFSSEEVDNGDLQLKKLRLFVITNKQYIRRLSRRYGIGEDRYFRYEDCDSKEIIKGRSNTNRYSALNISFRGQQTVEFRMFRGTLNYNRILATLQFVEAVCYYTAAESTGITSLIKDKSWENFIDWCKQVERYSHFVRYWETEGKKTHLRAPTDNDKEDDIEKKTANLTWRSEVEYLEKMYGKDHHNVRAMRELV